MGLSRAVTLLPELLARQAVRTPDAPAVLDGGRELSYAALDGRANQLAQHLRRAGAGPGSLVCVCLPRSTDLIVALLAVWKAGAAYVPLDPDHPPQRWGWLLADCGANLLLTERALAEEVGETGATPLFPAALSFVEAGSDDAPHAGVTADSAAYAIYTSGSTGRPKGVVISHAGIANRVMWTVRRHRLDHTDRVLQKTTVGFDAAGWEIFAPLVSGGAVVLAPAGADRDPAALLRAVAADRVTVLQVVPSLLKLLVDEPNWDGCGSLRLLFCAGEPLHAELCRRLAQRTRARVFNTYGPTECAIDVTAHQVDPAQTGGPVPIGRPITGMRVLVLGPAGNLAPVGVPGELHAGGPGVARGYLGQPALTAERFVPDPYGPPGSRLYRTGDRARWRPHGALEYLGRLDGQVTVNGVRVEPVEVETALAAYPGVQDAVVTPFRGVDGGTRLAGYVVCPTGDVRPDQLRGFLRRTLPEPLVPSAFIAMEAFPTTPSGKVDRSALPDPSRDQRAGRPPYVPPRTPAEQTVVHVWERLLDIDGVGAHDDFFRLGGSSLSLVRLASRLGAAAGREVTIAELVSASTVDSQAPLLEATEARVPAVRRVRRDRPLPLSFGQRRLWFLDEVGPGDPQWVLPLALRLPAHLPPGTVRHALEALAARHEILRTRYVLEAGEPRQVIDESGPVALRVVDLAPGEEVRRVLGAERRQGFDLARGPVWRAVLIRAPGDDHLLLVEVHQIASDSWSSVVLGDDIRVLCTALHDGVEPELARVPVQYADYAVSQRRWLTDGVLEPQLRFWRQELAGYVPVELPTDWPRPAVRDARGATVAFTVPVPVAVALAELGRRRSASLFMTLLTAFATLLARTSGEWSVAVCTPVAGRPGAEVSGVVGPFVNSLVLRCRLAADISFEQALDRVRRTSRSAFANQDLPLERLEDELHLTRPINLVTFEVMDGHVTSLELGGRPGGHGDLAALPDLWRVARTDLSLAMYRVAGGGIEGVFAYATALFDAATIEWLADRFLHLLGAIAAEPTASLSTVDGDSPGRYDRWNSLLDTLSPSTT